MRWPILQLLHISDLHWSPLDVSEVPLRGFIDRVTRWVYGHAPLNLRQGLAGHDPIAIDDFRDSIENALDEPDEWEGRTWLAMTGDLSTWADDASLAAALDFIQSTARHVGVGWTAVYGNHDVWPGRYPEHPFHYVHRPADLDARRTLVRQNFFPGDWPLLPLTEGLGAGARPLTVNFPRRRGRLVCYSLNTVVHNPGLNGFALGAVSKDRYWEPNRTLARQLDVLQAQWQNDDVGVVLIHHPVHDPAASDPADRWRDVLVNHEDVAAGLTGRAAIVLAGHTHQVFPRDGHLPGGAPRRTGLHEPLGDGQAQLIAGTLAQSTMLHEAQQSWQRLRFFETDQPGLVLERVVYTRQRGQSGFERGDPQEMTF